MALALDDHRFVVMDVFDYYKYAKRHELSYDVIVLDPPSFARNKKGPFQSLKITIGWSARPSRFLNQVGP